MVSVLIPDIKKVLECDLSKSVTCCRKGYRGMNCMTKSKTRKTLYRIGYMDYINNNVYNVFSLSFGHDLDF